MDYAIGIDIGGTKSSFAVFDGEGNVIYSERYLSKGIFSEANDPAICLLSRLSEFCLKYSINMKKLIGVIIGVPGKVNPTTGMITSVPNLKILENKRLGYDLSQVLNLPVIVENDVNLIAIGEHHKGAGKDCDNFACVYVGTGIGGGLIINGKLYSGVDGAAGELGHMPILYEGQVCTCGARGCLEMYCSGKALARQAGSILKYDGQTVERYYEDEDWSLAAQVINAAKHGNLAAIRSIEEAFFYLGLGIVQLATIVNPQMVLLGGGIINAWPEGLNIVNETVKRVASVPYKDNLIVKLAELKDEASFAGSFALISQISIHNDTISS